ncbi:hypothetical protein C7B65_01545 [Phormidesmis priestleyi ULC007]|uniref:Uncharacterized protein n=1 Tax=Phormidesmis priestleyi ULC007 TaxID=1920490 RepID=A0A2T1DNP3_9CYAN|nr:hypothetical protein [Phormidesmis priestleyi]PSB22118.1 hypothetical protein C7B65_01545 [Phormidesmis priestleyi ULC007]PZO54914.1 MAG: hypothetical protein DCF14_00030 [Phormidesmis priestleyi]
MQSLLAIAVFVMLTGGVIFGVSRYRHPAKSEQPTELQDSTATAPPAIAAMLVSDQATVHSEPEFKPSAIADPWEIDSTPTIAALTEEGMPD